MINNGLIHYRNTPETTQGCLSVLADTRVLYKFCIWIYRKSIVELEEIDLIGTRALTESDEMNEAILT